MKNFKIIVAVLALVTANLAIANAPAEASSISEANIGTAISFDLTDAIGAQNITDHYADCTAYNIVTTVYAADQQVVSTQSETLNDAHCFYNSQAWASDFAWNTKCTNISPDCIWLNDEWFAKPGDYRIDFTVSLDYVDVTNSVTATLNPAYLYKTNLQNNQVFAYKDGYLDDITGTLDAVDETGSTLDPSSLARMVLASGSNVVATTAIDSSGSFKFTPSKLKPGTYSVRLLPNNSLPETFVNIAAIPTVAAKATAVKAFDLSVPVAVYPVKDGFEDNARISITVTPTGSNKSKVTGSMSLLHGSKVIETVQIKKYGTTAFTWNGRVKGALVTGAFKVKATVAGAEGKALSQIKPITVSPKKLVTTTSQATYGAYAAADESQGDSFEPIDRYGTQGARFYSSGDGDLMVVKLSVPLKSGVTKWRIRFNNWSAYAFHTYYPCNSSDCLADFVKSQGTSFSSGHSGTTWTKWTTAGLPSDVANFEIGSIDWGSLYVDSFTIEMQRTTLK